MIEKIISSFSRTRQYLMLVRQCPILSPVKTGKGSLIKNYYSFFALIIIRFFKIPNFSIVYPNLFLLFLEAQIKDASVSLTYRKSKRYKEPMVKKLSISRYKNYSVDITEPNTNEYITVSTSPQPINLILFKLMVNSLTRLDKLTSYLSSTR